LQAIQCFEKVLQADKDNYESLKILGSLYLQRGKLDKVYYCLERRASAQCHAPMFMYLALDDNSDSSPA
jgi:lipopolysaccharide biosynthesis regulator YciM